MFGLFGCKRQKTAEPPQENPAAIEISVTVEIAESDFWIMPDTDRNNHSSAWGKATVLKEKSSSGQSVSVQIPESAGTYLIRMIDAGEMYYSANGITLEDHSAVVIREGDEDMTALVEVYSPDGTLAAKYEMFVARL